MPIRATFPSLHRQEFQPVSVKLLTNEQKLAWSQFITAYQHLLFLWTLTAECCVAAIYFVGRRDSNSASIWVRRAARLMLACAAGIKNARNITSESYSTLASSEVSAFPVDFREDGFIEYQFMKASIEETSSVLAEAKGADWALFQDMCFSFSTAETIWFERINSYTNRETTPQVMETTGYDDAFGIIRTPEMFVEDYHYALRDVINDFCHNTDRTRLDAMSNTWLDDGNKLMNVIVEELLDPPSYQPTA